MPRVETAPIMWGTWHLALMLQRDEPTYHSDHDEEIITSSRVLSISLVGTPLCGISLLSSDILFSQFFSRTVLDVQHNPFPQRAHSLVRVLSHI